MNQKLTMLVAVAMLGTSGAAYAQASANVDATGSTRILQAISIAKDSDLQFGSIVRPSTAGTNTVAVSTANGRTLTGTGGGALASGGTVSAAAFTVTGEGGQTFSITPAATFTMNRTSPSGGGSITVTTAVDAGSGTLGGSIGSTGTKSFNVGGSFDVSNTTPTGTYSGTFNVVVAYN